MDSSLVKPKLAVWQIYFNQHSAEALDKGFIPYSNKGKCTEYFENEVIIDIWKNNKELWKDADYVGVLSWRFREKTNITSEKLESYILKSAYADVFSMSPTIYDRIPSPYSSNAPAVIKAVCRLIDQHNVLPFKIEGYDSRGKFKNFCNYFVCTPEVFNDYVESCLNKLYEWFKTCEDKELASLLNEKILHRNTLHPIHAFVMEGLFECYVEYKKCSYSVINNNNFYEAEKRFGSPFLKLNNAQHHERKLC
jgi:hypothetical protein